MGAYEHYLAHHGVKGQKWGIRRYQNPDGTLTAEGRAKYAKELELYRKKNDAAAMEARKGRKNARVHSNNVLNETLRKTLLSDYGLQAFANWRERRDALNLKKAQDSGNARKEKKYESKLAAQSKANADKRAYRERTGSGKIAAKHVLMTPVGSYEYSKYRARGSSRLGALIKTGTIIPGLVSNKRKYGKWIVWSGMEEE